MQDFARELHENARHGIGLLVTFTAQLNILNNKNLLQNGK
jgi:hypothetical protein